MNPVNIVIKPTFAALTELTFTVYSGTNLYDCVKKDMVLEVDDFGRFAITDVSEEDDGQTKTKSVTANSYEITMNKYTLTYEDNLTFPLWDESHPEACWVIMARCTLLCFILFNSRQDGQSDTLMQV